MKRWVMTFCLIFAFSFPAMGNEITIGQAGYWKAVGNINDNDTKNGIYSIIGNNHEYNINLSFNDNIIGFSVDLLLKEYDAKNIIFIAGNYKKNLGISFNKNSYGTKIETSDLKPLIHALTSEKTAKIIINNTEIPISLNGTTKVVTALFHYSEQHETGLPYPFTSPSQNTAKNKSQQKTQDNNEKCRGGGESNFFHVFMDPYSVIGKCYFIPILRPIQWFGPNAALIHEPVINETYFLKGDHHLHPGEQIYAIGIDPFVYEDVNGAIRTVTAFKVYKYVSTNAYKP